MARLSKTERKQIMQAAQGRFPSDRRLRASAADYVAFATVAARFARLPKPKPIVGGTQWKL